MPQSVPGQQIQIEPAIIIGVEYGLAIVAALRDVVRDAGAYIKVCGRRMHSHGKCVCPLSVTVKIAIVSAVLFGSLAAESPRVLSVCEAARVGGHLDGKTVRIRGVWRKAFPGLGLFDELADTDCPGVEIHVVSTAASLPHPPPVGYKLDIKSARIAQRLAVKALADGRDLSATIVGVLYVQKKEDYVQARPLNKDVTAPPHHKWYPLILLMQSVPDIKER